MEAILHFKDGTERKIEVRNPPPQKLMVPEANPLKARHYKPDDALGYYNEYGQFIFVDEDGKPEERFTLRRFELTQGLLYVEVAEGEVIEKAEEDQAENAAAENPIVEGGTASPDPRDGDAAGDAGNNL